MNIIKTFAKAFKPIDLSTSSSKIELYANRELVMTGCTHIAEFSSEQIQLNAQKGFVKISGSNLELLLLAKRTVAVRGKIRLVELGE